MDGERDAAPQALTGASGMTIIDGLVISDWSRETFESMHRGGLTAANCTCSVWENARDTILEIAAWKRRFEEHADIIRPVRHLGDIDKAREEGRVGIILGWQNTSAIEDRLDLLPIFYDLGVRVAQLTYNTQNLVGAGCLEESGGGLTGFGREAVAEMNRLGILVDLSHVGERTSREAIESSRMPCAYTHVCPMAIFEHPRNKTDEQLRFIVDRGGFAGFATFPPFLPRQADTTLEDCVEAIEHMQDVCGTENVGLGTDFTQGRDESFFAWLRHDKGYARRVMPGSGKAPFVKEFETLADYPNLVRALEARGWSQAHIEGFIGGNWYRFLGRVWTE